MAIYERIILDPGDAGSTENDRPERVGQGFRTKRLADGRDGGPQIILGIQPEAFVNPAHFHDMPQFQVILKGTVKFPAHALIAPAVHYSDRNSPYGPFVPGHGFVLGVYRNGPASQTYMSDRDGRKRRVPGREYYGQAADMEWTPVPAHAYLAEKLLIRPTSPEAPSASMVRCNPGAHLPPWPAPFGRYELVLDGSLISDDAVLKPYSARYARNVRAERHDGRFGWRNCPVAGIRRVVSIGSAEDPVGFVPVAASTQVKESEIIAVQISGVAIAVARSDGTVYAAADQCSHQGCPLSTGFVEDAQIECECHGARFDLRTGKPTFLPATLPIPVYAAYESDDTIFVRFGERAVCRNVPVLHEEEGGSAPRQMSEVQAFRSGTDSS